MTQENPSQKNPEMKPFIDLAREGNIIKTHFQKEIYKDIEIPGFPTKPLSATWELWFGGERLRGIRLNIARKGETTNYLVEIAISDMWDGGKIEELDERPHFFDVHHRFVHRDKMTEEEKKVKGIGSFALRKTEDTLRYIINSSPNNIPREIGMLTNQPDVILFAEKNGYKITNERQRGDYKILMDEIKEYKTDSVFIEQGILPHFRFINVQLVTPDGPQYIIENVIVNLDKLKKYCEEKSPEFEKYTNILDSTNHDTVKTVKPVKNPRYAFLEIDIGEYSERRFKMRSDQPHPFFTDFYFSKNL